MVIIKAIKIWVIWISRTFSVSIYLSICNFPYFLTDKQKTKKIDKVDNLKAQAVLDSIEYNF